MKNIFFVTIFLSILSCKDIYTEGTTIAKIINTEIIAYPAGRTGLPSYGQEFTIRYQVEGEFYEGTFKPRKMNQYTTGDYLYIKRAKNPNKFKIVSKVTVEESVKKNLDKVF